MDNTIYKGMRTRLIPEGFKIMTEYMPGLYVDHSRQQVSIITYLSAEPQRLAVNVSLKVINEYRTDHVKYFTVQGYFLEILRKISHA